MTRSRAGGGPCSPETRRWREREFGSPSEGASARAAAIGTIEALVASRHSSEAIAPCAEALSGDEPTVPLLVACGEAHARTADPVGAIELYERAVAMAPDRPGLAERADELRVDGGGGSSRDGARERLRRAPRRGPAATRACARLDTPFAGQSSRARGTSSAPLGERERALEYYREAIALGGGDPAVDERAGDLALELGDFAAAVSIFDGLAAQDPRFADRAAEARLAFRIANWPDAERQAAQSRRLTRAGAALLAWWAFPEVREAQVAAAGAVATDVLARRDSRVLMRAVSLGLLDVDPYTHRVRPDAPLTRAAAARMLLLLAARLAGPGPSPECFQGAPGPGKGGQEAIRVAVRCKLLSESGASVVSGAEFTRGLDCLRSLFPAGEAVNRD